MAWDKSVQGSDYTGQRLNMATTHVSRIHSEAQAAQESVKNLETVCTVQNYHKDLVEHIALLYLVPGEDAICEVVNASEVKNAEKLKDLFTEKEESLTEKDLVVVISPNNAV